jgi:hypothetical protein
MAKEEVLKNVEEVIRIARSEIRKQKSCTSDKMRQLTGLVNAYTRLLVKSEELDGAGEIPDDSNGDPEYYDKMAVNAG